MHMPPLQWLYEPRPAPAGRFDHEHVHLGQPLPLQIEGLRLGRQYTREAASPAGAGAVVSTHYGKIRWFG